MKLLFIGDPHLKITKFELATRFIEWVNGVIEQERPDRVVNLGDTFDTHAVVRSEILSIYRDHVDYICGELGIKTYHILGNHEFYKPSDSKYHALQTFKGIENFHVIDERLDLHNENITMLPYIHDERNFPRDVNSILICHQDFKGCDYGFKKSEVTLDPKEVRADLIISGHIHKKQEYENVVYPGSPFAQSAGDVNQVKGLMMFDTETFERRFIQCPLPMWKKLEFEITPTFNVTELHESLSQQLDTLNHWIVDLTGLKSEIVSYLDTKEYKQLISDKDVKIKTNFTDKDKKTTTIKATSIQGIVSEYIDRVYSGSIDKNKVLKEALSLLSKSN